MVRHSPVHSLSQPCATAAFSQRPTILYLLNLVVHEVKDDVRTSLGLVMRALYTLHEYIHDVYHVSLIV